MTMQPKELAEKIAKIADDKKGKDILLLNMEGISYMTDYFVIVPWYGPLPMPLKTNWRNSRCSAAIRKGITMAAGC